MSDDEVQWGQQAEDDAPLVIEEALAEDAPAEAQMEAGTDAEAEPEATVDAAASPLGDGAESSYVYPDGLAAPDGSETQAPGSSGWDSQGWDPNAPPAAQSTGHLSLSISAPLFEHFRCGADGWPSRALCGASCREALRHACVYAVGWSWIPPELDRHIHQFQ
eukprot:gene4978-897_t